VVANHAKLPHRHACGSHPAVAHALREYQHLLAEPIARRAIDTLFVVTNATAPFGQSQHGLRAAGIDLPEQQSVDPQIDQRANGTPTFEHDIHVEYRTDRHYIRGLREILDPLQHESAGRQRSRHAKRKANGPAHAQPPPPSAHRSHLGDSSRARGVPELYTKTALRYVRFVGLRPRQSLATFTASTGVNSVARRHGTMARQANHLAGSVAAGRYRATRHRSRHTGSAMWPPTHVAFDPGQPRDTAASACRQRDSPRGTRHRSPTPGRHRDSTSPRGRPFDREYLASVSIFINIDVCRN